MDVLLFCGIQAAGKSTYYHCHCAFTHLLISKDLMGRQAHKERRQRELLHLALQAQHSVVIDNTNPTPAERVPLIEIAHQYGTTVIAYYFMTPLKQAIERNQQREEQSRIPVVALYSTAARLIPPTFEEGFDKIYYVQSPAHSTRTPPLWVVEELVHEE